jgi:hypothetical protein
MNEPAEGRTFVPLTIDSILRTKRKVWRFFEVVKIILTALVISTLIFATLALVGYAAGLRPHLVGRARIRTPMKELESDSQQYEPYSIAHAVRIARATTTAAAISR